MRTLAWKSLLPPLFAVIAMVSGCSCCKNLGDACTQTSECCQPGAYEAALTCAGGHCCSGRVGGACRTDADCCSGTNMRCDNGHCARCSPDGTGCAIGGTNNCCSRTCRPDGVCGPQCNSGGPCTPSDGVPCCTGSCPMGTLTNPGGTCLSVMPACGHLGQMAIGGRCCEQSQGARAIDANGMICCIPQGVPPPGGNAADCCRTGNLTLIGGQCQPCRGSMQSAGGATECCSGLRYDGANCVSCVMPGGGCNTASSACCNTCCGTVCVDTAANHDNCGACGTACAASQICTAGACVGCPAGTTACGNACFNLATDAMNCGTCGNVCPSTGGMPTCSAGVCGTSPCVAPAMLCSGACVHTASNPNHCGTCGTVCSGANGICEFGRCTLTGEAIALCAVIMNPTVPFPPCAATNPCCRILRSGMAEQILQCVPAAGGGWECRND